MGQLRGARGGWSGLQGRMRNVNCSVMSDSSVTPWTIACQAPLSIEFSRQEYWSGLPFPSPGDLPNLGIQPGSPSLQDNSLPSEPSGKPDRGGGGGGGGEGGGVLSKEPGPAPAREAGTVPVPMAQARGAGQGAATVNMSPACKGPL